jgi:cytochrome b
MLCVADIDWSTNAKTPGKPSTHLGRNVNRSIHTNLIHLVVPTIAIFAAGCLFVWILVGEDGVVVLFYVYPRVGPS